MDTTAIPTPFCEFHSQVEENWLDFNGHMNVAYYLRALDERLERLPVFDVRYMDDVLILAESRWKLRRALAQAPRWKQRRALLLQPALRQRLMGITRQQQMRQQLQQQSLGQVGKIGR